VVTGPSGVGKGTLIRELLDRVPGVELSVSATTRAPRPGEVAGREYHFLSDAEFTRRVERGDFLEHAHYAGNRYGTLRSELERDAAVVVLEVELQGARQVREVLPDAVRIFIKPPSLEELRERLERRGLDSVEDVESRLEAAREEIAAAPEFEHVIVNEDRARAADELIARVATIVSSQPRGAPT
jgi:guanylate kinase